jgi:hypothetical protein
MFEGQNHEAKRHLDERFGVNVSKPNSKPSIKMRFQDFAARSELHCQR